MAENSLVVSQHGLSRKRLSAWFSENVCEVARCRALRHPGSHLVELFLENETEVALHRFTNHFQEATARLASSDDLAALRCDRARPCGEVREATRAFELPVRACSQKAGDVALPLPKKEMEKSSDAQLESLEQKLRELEHLLRTGSEPGETETTMPLVTLLDGDEDSEDDSEDSDKEAEQEVGELLLELGACQPDRAPLPVKLLLHAGSGGGTGARLWSGGALLAEWLLRVAASEPEDPDQITDALVRLRGRDVLELGAGAAALPSVAVGRCSSARRVLATDALEAVVVQMRQNLSWNAPLVEAAVLDWLPAGRKRYRPEEQFDVVLFADGIYTERGALLLADAATALLRPGGVLVGALPDLRAGISSFESDLRARGFLATPVPLDEALLAAAARPHLQAGPSRGLVAGGSVEGYRLVTWRLAEEEQGLSGYPGPRRSLKARTPKRGAGRRKQPQRPLESQHGPEDAVEASK